MPSDPLRKPRLTAEDVYALQTLVFKDGPPDLPPPIVHYRHPYVHLDFWFLLAALGCMLATTTSMIEQRMLEPLIFAAIGFLIAALVTNLGRDRQVVLVSRPRWEFRLEWPVLGSMPKLSLREIQAKRLGSKPKIVP